MKRMTALTLALVFAFGLAACGKKGPLEPPPPRDAQEQQ
ncbi:LPS translocon maturation chaperone LptM [Tepidicaulis sp. LMO-SS28]